MTIFSRRGTRSAVSLVAATAATLTLAPAAFAAEATPTNARDCVAADYVWVNVDFDAKTTKGGCATEFTTGAEALESAGFKLNEGQGKMVGFLVGINDVIPIWDETQTYWGSWNGTVKEGGAIDYSYYEVGAFQSKPQPGTIEAWSVGDGKQLPSLQKLPAAPAPEEPAKDFSSENKVALGVGGAIAAILAIAGGVLAALHMGIFTVPGWENFKH